MADTLLCCFYVFFLIIVPLVFFVVPMITGQMIERKHFRELEAREAEIRKKVLVHNRKTPVMKKPARMTIVAGEVCMGADRFKTWLAGFRQLVGGRMGSLSPVVERARREALLRALESAAEQGYTEVGNLRYTTANLKWNAPKQKDLLISVMAYGTAYAA
ncbi:MAG: YbjQ family protein [Thermoplasmatota archaeon]